MKKITVLIAGLLLISLLSNAQTAADTAWKTGGDVSAMFSQSSFSNWAGGGENAMTLNSFLNLYAKYEKGKSKWENLLGLAYGQNKTGDYGVRKSEDKIDLASTYGIKAASKWYYTVNFNFKSQFAPGYDYPFPTDSGKVKISNFMAPGYISLGLGMEYRPYDYMSFYFSPVTARMIVVNDQELADAGAFGVDKATYDTIGNIVTHGKSSKFEFGSYFRFIFKKDIIKNVNFSTKLELFSDYLDNPQNVDVNWDNMINMKVNKLITASFGWQLVYDDNTPIIDKNGNVGPRTQFRETLAVGLSYKFKNR